VNDWQVNFEFALTPEEAMEARRQARYFRMGHRQGTVTIVILSAILLGWAVFGIVQFAMLTRPGDQGPEIHDPQGIGAAALALAAFAVLMGSTLRGLTMRSRPLVPDGVLLRVQISAQGIQLATPDATRSHPWEEFTALEPAEHVYLVMTRNSYLAIPQRMVPAESRRDFEVLLRGLCLKQGPSNNFPVIFDDSNPPPDPPSEPSSAD
jgi:hypothetical protein